MSDYIDTFEGWRERTIDEPYPSHTPRLVEYDENNRTTRVWVREAPVPPLPTEPGYYIDADGCAWRLDEDREWDDTFGNPLDAGTPPKLPLTRYEPRAVTAKAVLDALMAGKGMYSIRLDDIARDFGVDS